MGGTVVFFEAPHRIRRTLEDLKEAVGDCQVVVARELTKIHEELVRGPITTVAGGASQLSVGEFVVVLNIGAKDRKYRRSIVPDRPADVMNLV